MSTGMPMRTADGELVGFAAVDLSMNEVIDHEHNLLLRLIVVFVIATIVASLIGIFVVDRTIVRPINLLSKTATTYTANDLRFSGIDIHTGDEIRRSSEDGDLQPWERLSAACGYAVYDPRLDADAASVFKRADEDMYVHKIRMKDAASSVRYGRRLGGTAQDELPGNPLRIRRCDGMDDVRRVTWKLVPRTGAHCFT